MARETDAVLKMIGRNMQPDDAGKFDFDHGINVATILVKNIPNYLVSAQNYLVVEELVKKWSSLCDYNVENVKK